MEERLQLLRQKLRLEWGQLAERLGLSRAMLDFVRKGQRNLSFKALNRLEDAERAAGILPPPLPIDVIKEDEEPPAQKNEIISDREELRAIAIALRDLCTRINRLEERMNK
jgi:transcriptional regulator with XRE-family HTH domain